MLEHVGLRLGLLCCLSLSLGFLGACLSLQIPSAWHVLRIRFRRAPDGYHQSCQTLGKLRKDVQIYRFGGCKLDIFLGNKLMILPYELPFHYDLYDHTFNTMYKNFEVSVCHPQEMVENESHKQSEQHQLYGCWEIPMFLQYPRVQKTPLFPFISQSTSLHALT